MSPVDLSPGRLGWARGTSDWFLDRWCRLWCELSVLDRLVPVDMTGIVTVCLCNGRGVSSREIGTEWNNEVIPEVIRIEGHGCSSRAPDVPITIDMTGDGGNGAVWVASTQLVLDASLVDCKDAVDWCHSSRYGCMDMVHLWLEWDVIGYWEFIPWCCCVKPDSKDDGESKKKSAGYQGAGYDDSIVVLHEGSR
ncbi:hypothetical protein ARMGADRAFT_1028397 [Armillaria gallica]|uniref:Uncharacterized protein n=1 Tax=Armillaria gallica TaxID=47427 RepID=A0A2H3E977_ARMGA|nr:hypothetical protein ARMGADRAFT_1028397 [Armillaria gallica]